MARSSIRVTLTNNTELVRQATEQAIQKGLEEIGQFIVKKAGTELENGLSDNNEEGELKSTGALKQSLTHIVKRHTVIVGSNLSYAPYVHEGTGKYNSSGSTGDKYWVYVINNGNGEYSHRISGKRYTFEEAKKIVAMMRSDGLDAHMTNGIKPNRFLRNAIMNNIDKIKNAFEWRLRNG